MPRQFDCYMVQIGIGTNRKLRRLPVAQRWAYVAGVLSLAAQSPMRGALLIADGEPVTAEDIAEEATIPVKDARAALGAFRQLGMVEKDGHDVEWVHDWDELNRDPKPSDSPEQARERKRRQRERERATRPQSEEAPDRHAPVTRDDERAVTRDIAESHAPEVEVEGEVEEQAPLPPQGERRRDQERFEQEMCSWAEHHFPAAEPRKVAALAVHLRTCGKEPTAEAMREYGEQHPAWALESQEPAAA